MFKAYRMAEEQNEQVRDILLLPSTVSEQVRASAEEQIAAVVDFFHSKLAEYNEIIQQNSRSVFVANYVQNRFLVTEFCPELAKLFEVLKVNTMEELTQKLKDWEEDPAMKASGKALLESFEAWDTFLREIDDELDKALGPVKTAVTMPEDSGILGLQSKTISYYVTGSAFDCVLIIVVRAFNKPEVNDHILGLYKRIDELRKLRCDVFLLTKGPPIGSSGGAYIKLIGVPFRKLYDMSEAEEQLKLNRKSALEYNGWKTLCKVVEASLVEGDCTTGITKEQSVSEDSVAYISQKGGTVLVDKSGEILYKHIEDDKTDSWPDIDEIVKLVEARNAKYLESNNNSTTSLPKGGNLAKVNSEISVVKELQTDKKKPCCVIS